MEFEITNEYIDRLKELIAEDNSGELKATMEPLHPADIAEAHDSECFLRYLAPHERLFFPFAVTG